MPRYIFPAGTVTNTTGAPLRLTFHATNTTGRRETDLWTVDGSGNLAERIPNGVILTTSASPGAYSAFAGPDDVDTLYVVKHDSATRTTITATGYVAGENTVLTNTFGQVWTSPTASTTLTGTLAAWVITAVDCTAGAGARTLPAASSVAAGTAVCAKKADTSANNLVVSRSGSDKIYGTGTGSTSKALSLAGEAVEFVSNGVDKWTVRSSDTPSGVLASTYLTQTNAAATYARSDRGIFIPAGWGAYWQTARAAAASTPCTVAIVGDSIGQGFHSSNLQTLSWASLLRTSLQTAYGDGGSGYFSTGFSVPAFSTIADWPVGNYPTVTGTWAVKGGTEGPGSVSIFNQNAPGSTLTFTGIRGTSVTVWYMTDPAFPGSFTVTIDGVVQGTTPSNSQAQNVRSQAYTVAAGTHTVVITTVGASGLTCIFGVAGSNSTGVVVHNFSYSGRKSADYAIASPTYGAPQSYSGGSGNQSDLLIYSLGVNDANTSVAVDTYLTNIRRHLDAVRGLGTRHGKMDILFLMHHIGKFDASGTPLYHRYMQQMRGMAEAYGAALVDLWGRYYNNWDLAADSSYWGDTTSSGSPGTDTVHPGDAGHLLIANLVTSIVTA